MDPIDELHGRIDADVLPLAKRHAGRLRCGLGCHDCCADGLTVLEVEAERIRTHAAALLQTGRPHPPGRCAFLGDAGECRVYAWRPYVCRTQGLPLRMLAETDAGEIVERRAICPLNDRGEHGDEPLDMLDEGDCWTVGPYEDELARLQEARDPDERRVALRDLFARDAD